MSQLELEPKWLRKWGDKPDDPNWLWLWLKPIRDSIYGQSIGWGDCIPPRRCKVRNGCVFTTGDLHADEKSEMDVHLHLATSTHSKSQGCTSSTGDLHADERQRWVYIYNWRKSDTVWPIIILLQVDAYCLYVFSRLKCTSPC